MKIFVTFILLSFSLQSLSHKEDLTKDTKRTPPKMFAPHIKKAIKLVGQFSKEDIEDLEPYVDGGPLDPEKRSYLHAIKYYYTIEDKYYRVKYEGANKDDAPLTNGVYRREQEAQREREKIRNQENRFWRSFLVAVGCFGLVK